jgi:catabolite regulation protein CreA
MIKVAQNKDTKPKILFRKTISMIQTKNILIKSVKIPKVSNLKGKVIRLTIGLIKTLINPNTNPAIAMVPKDPT